MIYLATPRIDESTADFERRNRRLVIAIAIWTVSWATVSVVAFVA